MKLQHSDLNNLPVGTTINANDIAQLSGQNQMKGIHPIFSADINGVVTFAPLVVRSILMNG